MEFDENGTRVQNDVYIQQYRREDSNSLSRVIFGTIQNNTFNFVSDENNSSVWPGNQSAMLLFAVSIPILDGIPPDGTPSNIVNGVHIAITTVYSASAIIGILFTISCLIFNIAFRKKRSVYEWFIIND